MNRIAPAAALACILAATALAGAQVFDPPVFRSDGGVVPAGYQFFALNPNASGDVWYTTDGTDPNDGGSVAASASPFVLFSGGQAVWVPAGETANWKYLDDGTDQGIAWREVNFDDDAWATGGAQLGYGDGDETTVISYGDDSQNKHITTYFRHEFVVDFAVSVESLRLRLLRDDGAVVYVNGVEVVRSNMPAGPVDFTTPAASSVVRAEEILWRQFDLDPAVLVDGTNVVAVEVHQDGPTGSDVSFDLELTGETIGLASPSTMLSIERDTVVSARVTNGFHWSNLKQATFYVDEVPTLEVTEVDYHPAAPSGAETALGFDDAAMFEFIEIRNHGAEQVVQLNASLAGDVTFQFGELTLAPGAYALVVSDIPAFEQRYGRDLPVVGEFSGTLGDDGGRIIVRASNGDDAVDFTYADAAPWPTDADGSGPSLNRVDPASSHDDPASWTALTASPGEAFSLGGVEGDFNGDGGVDVTDIDAMSAAVREGRYEADMDLDNDGDVDKGDRDILVRGVLATEYGDADLDGDVDLADFVTFKGSFGAGGAGWTDGDFDGDGVVGLLDFVMLKSAFGFAR